MSGVKVESEAKMSEYIWNSEKVHKFLFSAGTFVIMLMCILYAIYNNAYKTVKDIGADSPELMYHIDGEVFDGQSLQVAAWVIKKGISSEVFDIELICWNEAVQEGYIVPCALVVRHDVTEFIADGNNYDNSGFSAKVKNVSQRFREGQYELIIKTVIDKDIYYKHTGVKFDVD